MKPKKTHFGGSCSRGERDLVDLADFFRLGSFRIFACSRGERNLVNLVNPFRLIFRLLAARARSCGSCRFFCMFFLPARGASEIYKSYKFIPPAAGIAST